MGLLVGLAPAVVAPSGLNPFLPVKVAVLGIGLVALAATVRPAVPALPGWGRIAAVGLLGWLVIATIASAAPVTSFLGAPTRLLGLVAWLGFAAAAVLGAGVGRTHGIEASLALVARWSALPVVVGAVLAVSELAGEPLVPAALAFEGRVLGVFGNPGLTAGMLALVLPLVAGAAVSDRRWRVVHVTVVCLGAGTLVATQSRAAMVAVGLAGVTLLARHLVTADRLGSQVRRAAVVGAVGVTVAGIAVLATGRGADAAGALGGRVDTWAIAAEVVADDPVVGTGPEGFAAGFVTHVDEAFVIEHSRDQLTDRAHNAVLDVAAVGGVPAGLAFLVVLAGAAVTCWRRRDHALVPAAAVGVAAAVLQQQVLFVQPVHDTLLWFVVGIVAAPLGSAGADGSRRAAARTTARVAVIVTTAAVALVGAAAHLADRAAADAYRTSGAASVQRAEQAVARFPSGDLYGLVLADRALATQEPALLERVREPLAAAEARAHATGEVRLARVDVLQRIHQRSPGGHPAALDDAEVLLATLLERDPTNGEAWLKLGVVAHERGERAAAVDAWRRAERLLPGRSEPAQNLEAVGAATAG